MEKQNKVVVCSGYFNPLHIGHIKNFKAAKKLGDFLVVIVNNDRQLKLKGRPVYMPEEERLAIIKSLKMVDGVVLSVDKDKTIAKTLAKIKPHILAKGGDRNISNLPQEEIDVCKEYNIQIIDGVGGNKIQSSSWILNKIYNEYKKLQSKRP
jgi:D-beta-D-heptose 7-phosphate kinase/D-beta-D-heptose 1-phosphate adenosyltransferase